MDWFPYDIGLCHERVKTYQKIHLKNHTRKSQCSYLLVQSQQWKQQNKVWNLFKVNNKDTRTTSMTKGCFHYWLWPSKCRLGTSKSKSLMENFAYLTGWKDFVLAVFFLLRSFRHSNRIRRFTGWIHSRCLKIRTRKAKKTRRTLFTRWRIQL